MTNITKFGTRVTQGILSIPYLQYKTHAWNKFRFPVWGVGFRSCTNLWVDQILDSPTAFAVLCSDAGWETPFVSVWPTAIAVLCIGAECETPCVFHVGLWMCLGAAWSSDQLLPGSLVSILFVHPPFCHVSVLLCFDRASPLGLSNLFAGLDGVSRCTLVAYTRKARRITQPLGNLERGFHIVLLHYNGGTHNQ